jgi:hypothetical protein
MVVVPERTGTPIRSSKEPAMTTRIPTRSPLAAGYVAAPVGQPSDAPRGYDDRATDWARYSEELATPGYPAARPAPAPMPAGPLAGDRVQVVGRGSMPAADDLDTGARRNGMGFDQTRYWVGSALTALVAALVGIVCLTVVNGVLHRRILDVDASSSYGVHVGAYGLIAALLALGMSMLFVAIAHFAPRPSLYFGWLGGLGVLLAVVLPFTMTLPLVSQAIFAGINALVGAVIVILVPLAVVRER